MRLLLAVPRLVPRTTSFGFSRGKASANWPLKKPRSYRRRLYDAALEPMVPKVQSVCPSFKEVNDYFKDLKSSFDMALVKHIRNIIRSEGYQVMGICHRLAVKQRTEWLLHFRLRLKGLDARDYGNRIMRKVFEDTPLKSLNDTIFVAANCQIFGKDINAIKTIITECRNIDWLIPIGNLFDISVSVTVEELCKLPSLEDHRAQTIQLLSLPSSEFISTISYHMLHLISTLNCIGNKKSSP
ncbi:unnamed protein product [Thelazia callipaeda]|uniref:Large ribosomal subunit protein uL10m n=1 Tax=Thelazia callipaeda TaxID=103827 RepID=A0A0N5CKT1_THECL|nr:unnamed protein product [Thelazia callipaeda]